MWWQVYPLGFVGAEPAAVDGPGARLRVDCNARFTSSCKNGAMSGS